MRNLLPFLFLVLLQLSCGTLPTGDKNRTMEEIDGLLLSKKADDLSAADNFALARQYYADAYAKFTLVDNITGKARVLAALVKLAISQTDTTEAAAQLKKLEVYGAFDETALKYYLNATLHFLQFSGDKAKMADLLRKSEGGKDPELQVLLLTFKLNNILKDPDSVELLKLSALLSENAGGLLISDPLLVSFSRYSLARAWFNKGEYTEALKEANLALETDKQFSHSKGILSDLLLLGDIRREQADYRGSVNYYMRAYEIEEQLRPHAEYSEIRVKLDVARFSLNGSGEGRALLQKHLKREKNPRLIEIITEALKK